MLRTSSIVRAALALAIALPGLATVVRAQYEPSQMAAWAAWVEDIERGWADVAHPEFGVVSFGLDTAVLGPAEGTAFDVVSLGDGGSVTVGFDESIVDGPGDDLAVFENGFFEDTTGLMFAELAFVEVSTNGVDFARFPSRTWSTEAVGSEGTIDPVDYEGFGGLDPAGLGTGFDLSALAGHPLVQQGLLDLDDVVYVRLVDVIGDGSTSDALANPVYDPYPTAHAAGGMDADAVGALNVPEPAATTLLAFGIPGVLVLARRRRARSRRFRQRRRGQARALGVLDDSARLWLHLAPSVSRPSTARPTRPPRRRRLPPSAGDRRREVSG